MAHLADMEELLHKIPNRAIANYMEEALRCYNAGAYRGCIVLSYIALFDDLVRKLSGIRHVNQKAREIHSEIVRRQNDQDVYENYLLEQLAANKIISELDSSTANLIKERRNKAAHASGHSPSAEEARFVYHEVITKFLIKEAYSSKVLADEILLKIESKYLFPSTTIGDVKGVVEYETNHLHVEAYPYLLAKLKDHIKSSNAEESQNSRFFIDGLAALDDPSWNEILTNKFLEKSLDNEVYAGQCLSIISINPTLMGKLTTTAFSRLKKIISENIQNMPISSAINNPALLFENILRKDRDKLIFLENETLEFLRTHSYLAISIEMAKVSDNIWRQYIGLLISKAGASTFEVANNFANKFPVIDASVSQKADVSDLLKMFIGVVKSAKRGAWRSEAVIASKFETFIASKSRVIEYCANNSMEAGAILIDELEESYTTELFVREYLIKESI